MPRLLVAHEKFISSTATAGCNIFQQWHSVCCDTGSFSQNKLLQPRISPCHWLCLLLKWWILQQADACSAEHTSCTCNFVNNVMFAAATELGLASQPVRGSKWTTTSWTMSDSCWVLNLVHLRAWPALAAKMRPQIDGSGTRSTHACWKWVSTCCTLYS